MHSPVLPAETKPAERDDETIRALLLAELAKPTVGAR